MSLCKCELRYRSREESKIRPCISMLSCICLVITIFELQPYGIFHSVIELSYACNASSSIVHRPSSNRLKYVIRSTDTDTDTYHRESISGQAAVPASKLVRVNLDSSMLIIYIRIVVTAHLLLTLYILK